MDEKQPQHTTKEVVSRKLWVFTCRNCQKKRRLTFYKSKASIGLCRSCRTSALKRHHHPNQLTMFGLTPTALFVDELVVSDPANLEKWNPEPELSEI